MFAFSLRFISYLSVVAMLHLCSLVGDYTWSLSGAGLPWVMPLRFAAIGFSTAIGLFLHYALGRLVLALSKRGGKANLSLVELIICGMACLQIESLVLGLLGLYQPGLLIFVFCFPLLFSSGPRLVRDVSYGCRVSLKTQAGTFAKLSILLILIVFSLRSFLPIIDWDSLVYHIPAIKRFLMDGTFWVYESNDPFNFPMSYALGYAPYVALKLYEACALQTCLLFYASAIGLPRYILRSKSFNFFYGLSLLFIFTIPAIWANAFRCQPETIIFACLLAAFYSLRRLWFSGGAYNLVSLALIVGYMASCKLSGLLLALPIVAVLVIPVIRNKVRLSPALLILALGVLVVPSIFWYGKNYLVFGSISYPKFVIQSETNGYTNDVLSFGRRYLKHYDHYLTEKLTDQSISELNKELLKIVRNASAVDKEDISLNAKYSLLDLVFNQDIYTRKPLDRYNHIMLIGLIPIWFLNRRIRLLGAVALLFTFAMLLKSHLIRYALPVFPVFAVLAAYNLNFLALKLRFRISKFLFASGLVLYCVVSIAGNISLAHSDYRSTISLLSGEITVSSWLSGRSSLRDPILYAGFPQNVEVERAVSEVIKSDITGIFMVGDSKTLYLEVPYVGDYDMIGRQVMPWLRLLRAYNGNHKLIAQSLKSEGISHFYVDLVLYANMLKKYTYYYNNQIWVKDVDYCDPQLLEWALWDVSHFLERYGKQVRKHPKLPIFVYELSGVAARN